MKKEIKSIYKNQSDLNDIKKEIIEMLYDAYKLIYNEVEDDVKNYKEVLELREKIWDAYNDAIAIEFEEVEEND